MDGFDLQKSGAQIVEGFGHLFGIAAGGEFSFLQEADAAREVLGHFLAAGLKFGLTTAQFLEGGAFTFEFLLRPLEFAEFLLGLGDFGIYFLAGWSALKRTGEGGGGLSRGFVGLKISVHKFGRIVVGCHAATLIAAQEK
jgi:hypothetical protein